MSVPPPLGDTKVDRIDRPRGPLWVVRDDLYPGGTKARVLPGVLDVLDAPETVVYASPVFGYAQIALGHAARATGRRAVVFCAARRRPHPRTLEAAAAGADVREVAPGYLTVVQARARAWAADNGALLLPFGVDVPAMHDALAGLARALPIVPAEAWSVAGSGTLSRALQEAWPGIPVHAVRIGSAFDPGRARVWEAPEPFERPARIPPPWPSCDNYDAKAWRFVGRHAAAGALLWNVAA